MDENYRTAGYDKFLTRKMSALVEPEDILEDEGSLRLDKILGSTIFSGQSTDSDNLLEIDWDKEKITVGDNARDRVIIGNFAEEGVYGAQFTAANLWFATSGGMCFASIYANDANDTLTISDTGQANKVQVTTFDTNGESNNATPDHTNDHITVTKAGIYLCNVSLHVKSVGAGGADTIGYSVYKNNGATEFADLHGQRDLSGGGGDEGSISLSGIIDLAVNDTIEVWIWNNDSTDDIVVDDINLSLVQVGG